MRPQILETDVRSLEGELDVDDLHSSFLDSFLQIKEARKALPDWLQEQNPEDYKERRDTLEYDQYIQGEMAAWLSKQNGSTISAEEVQEKYLELKQAYLDRFERELEVNRF